MASAAYETAGLRKFDLFENLSDDELSLIAKETRILTFSRDEIVCEEDSESDSMFLIHSGSLNVTKKGVALAQLSRGDYFGEMSLITGDRRNATVTTLEPAV